MTVTVMPSLPVLLKLIPTQNDAFIPGPEGNSDRHHLDGLFCRVISAQSFFIALILIDIFMGVRIIEVQWVVKQLSLQYLRS